VEIRDHRGKREVDGSSDFPNGFAQSQSETINLSEWREIVTKDDPVIGVHISPGSPLGIEECAKSINEAIWFFEKYFPKIAFRAFVCDSWLLDPHLKQVQPEESNIVQFQKYYNLVPSPTDAEYVTVRTIFGTDAVKNGIDSVPHTTGLQKRAAEFKRSGRRFRGGLGVVRGVVGKRRLISPLTGKKSLQICLSLKFESPGRPEQRILFEQVK